MPAQEPTAPWDNQSNASSDNGATATAEATPPSTAKPDTTADPDYQAFQRSQKASTDDTEGQPDSEAPDLDPKSEAASKDTKPDSGEPAKIEFTPKAAKYAKELGVSEDDAFDVALRAYDRDGVFTEDELAERFKKDAKSFIEIGLKVAKRQKDTDRAFNAFQRTDKAEQQPAEEAEPVAQQAPPQPLPDEIKQVIDSAFEPLMQDELLKDLHQPLGIAFTTIADKLGQHYGEQLKQAQAQYEQSASAMQNQIQALNGFIVDAQLEKVRGLLVADYPTLSDETVNQRVLKMYDTLINGSHDFKTPEEAYRKAVSAELGEESTLSLRKRLLTEHQTRKQGQPKVPNRGSDSDRKLSAEEIDRQAFNRAMKRNGR